MLAGRRSVLSAVEPRPGKCLAVAATPAAWRPSREGRAGARHAAGLRAEAAALVGDEAAGPGHVEHGCEVHVDARPGERGARRLPLGAGVRGAAGPHRGGARLGRPGQALDQAALLVHGDDHRRPQGLGPRGRLKRGGEPGDLGGAADVVREEDHAGELPPLDDPQQAARCAAAVEPADDPLAGELAGRQACCRRGLGRERGRGVRRGRCRGALAAAAAQRRGHRREGERACESRPAHRANLSPRSRRRHWAAESTLHSRPGALSPAPRAVAARASAPAAGAVRGRS